MGDRFVTVLKCDVGDRIMSIGSNLLKKKLNDARVVCQGKVAICSFNWEIQLITNM